MTRGFLTIAVNSSTGDYIGCAELLAHSIRLTQIDGTRLSVMVPMDAVVPNEKAFEHVIRFDPSLLPGIEWNSYLKYHALTHSPYDETILMDADMFVPVDLSAWWDWLSHREMVFSTNVYTYKGAPVREETNPYRLAFRDNNLPNIYTGLVYFRKTELVQSITRLAEQITKEWPHYLIDRLRGHPESQPTDDMVMACAIKELGAQHEVTLDNAAWFSFVHMKSRIQRVMEAGNLSETWTNFLNTHVDRDGSMVIGSYLQMRPVHYHDRAFLTPERIALLRSS